MQEINLTSEFIELNKKSPRTIGRFNCSEVWAIERGYIVPENYCQTNSLPFSDLFRMWEGTIKHSSLQPILEAKKWLTEQKKEYAFASDCVLVGKADALTDDMVIEIKTSNNLIPEAKSWHLYQTQLYCTLFEKEIGVVVQPIIKKTGLYLKEIGKVRRDDIWFNKRIIMLTKFHQIIEERIGSITPPRIICKANSTPKQP